MIFDYTAKGFSHRKGAKDAKVLKMKFKFLSNSQNDLPCLRVLLIFFALSPALAPGASVASSR